MDLRSNVLCNEFRLNTEGGLLLLQLKRRSLTSDESG